MTSPINSVGRRISLRGEHGEAEIWGKQEPKPIAIDWHAPAYIYPRWLARCTRYVDGGEPVVERIEDVTLMGIMRRVCAGWFPSIGEGIQVACSWDDLWDTDLTREENVRVHGGRHGNPAPDVPWTMYIDKYWSDAAGTGTLPAPNRTRKRLPMKAEAEGA